MRYILLGFLLVCVAVVSIAGFRGEKTRRPPIELFPDMDRQPMLRPQAPNSFFPDQLSSRLPVSGTVHRGMPYEDSPLNTGRITGTTNFVVINPLPVTEQLLARGRERYQIHCTPCHGETGEGNGITTKFGMTIIANLHDYSTRKLVQMPDGEIFNTITQGKVLMGGYGAQIDIADRWAIIAYVRALQRSRLGGLEDVPEMTRSTLK